MAEKSSEKEKAVASSDSNIIAAVGYILGILAILLYLWKKDDKFVRFHALQSVLLNVVMFVIVVGWSIVSMVLGIVTGGVGSIAYVCVFPIMLVFLVLGLFALYKAFTGEKYMIPLLGGFADKYV